MRLSKAGWLLGLGVVLGLSTWMAVLGQPPVGKRLPVPDKTAEAKAKDIVLFVFGEDLAEAKDPVKMNKLAERMLLEASRSGDDSANRFVLYSEVRDLAIRAGNAKLALSVIDELAEQFDVDALEMKAAALAKIVSPDLGTDTVKALINETAPLIQKAVDADNYALAIKLGKVVTQSAILAKSAALIADAKKLNEQVLVLQKGFAHMQAYMDRLQKNPKDEEANAELGKYHALVKGRWDKALPYLAKGNDMPLKTLAELDLSQPKDPHKQLALADGWWALANEVREPARKNDPAKIFLMIRASYWYGKAMDQLSGLSRARAIRRIEALETSLAGTGAVVPVGEVGPLKKFVGHTDDVKSVAISSDSRFGASGGSDNTVRVWDLASGKEEKVLSGHTKQVWAVAFHLGHQQVLSASWDATVRLWDVKTGSTVRRFVHRLDVNGLAVSRDGNTMLTASDDYSVYLWNVQSGEEIRRFSGHTNFVYCVAFSPDGRLFASGGVDKTVRVAELATGAIVRIFEGHTNSVTNVVFAPDGRSVYSCGDGAAHQWELATGKEQRRYEHRSKSGNVSNVLSLALSSDGRRLCTGGDDKAIRIWDTVTGKESLPPFEGHSDSVTSLAISADGHRLLSGSLDRTVRLWGLPNR